MFNLHRVQMQACSCQMVAELSVNEHHMHCVTTVVGLSYWRWFCAEYQSVRIATPTDCTVACAYACFVSLLYLKDQCQCQVVTSNTSPLCLWILPSSSAVQLYPRSNLSVIT